MSDESVKAVELTDDTILETNQNIRHRLVNELIKDQIPTDKDSCQVLLQAMKDMDKQVIDKKRVAIDSKGIELATTVSAVADKILQLFGNTDPFKRVESGSIPETDVSRLPNITPVPGETDIGIVGENYDSFMSVHGKDRD